MSGSRLGIGLSSLLREARIQPPPPEQFRSSEGYFATALHELNHWSGLKSILDCDLSGRFGTAAYAAEELMAEIGAASQSIKAGKTAEPPEDRAHFLKSWITVLKADNRASLIAACKAQKGAVCVQGLQPPLFIGRIERDESPEHPLQPCGPCPSRTEHAD